MRYLLAACMIALMAQNAFCEERIPGNRVYTLSAGMGVMRGHTTYQVGGNYETPEESGRFRFPISELVFPLDVACGSVGAGFDLAERLEVTAALRKNVSENAGQMKDRDWGQFDGVFVWSSPDTLDVSSVADTKIDVLGAEISTRLYLNPMRYRETEFVFYLGGKYIYQKFDFTASNLDQWYPSMNDYYGYDVGHVRISGDVLSYEVTREIPAAVAGLKLAIGPNISFDATFGYAPYATVRDEDHHPLRSLVTKADCDGDATLFAITGEVKLFPRCAFSIRYDYTTLDTKGIETQYHEEGYVAFIEQKNFSDVHMYEITMDYRF